MPNSCRQQANVSETVWWVRGGSCCDTSPNGGGRLTMEICVERRKARREIKRFPLECYLSHSIPRVGTRARAVAFWNSKDRGNAGAAKLFRKLWCNPHTALSPQPHSDFVHDVYTRLAEGSGKSIHNIFNCGVLHFNWSGGGRLAVKQIIRKSVGKEIVTPACLCFS